MKSIKAPKAKRLPSGSWMCRVMANGIDKCFTGPIKSEVEKAALEFKTSMTPRSISSKTVGAAVLSYIEKRRNVLSPSTVRGYETIQRCRFLKLQKMPIKNLKEADCQEAINEEALTVKAKTVTNSWGLFASAIKAAGGPSFDNLTMPQVPDNDTPWLDPDQLKIFLEAIKGHSCEMAALLALHSLRRSEILDLTKDDIEFTDQYTRIHVRGSSVLGPDGMVHKETNKSSSSARVVDVWHPRLVELLRKAPEGLLFTQNRNAIYEQVNRICRKAGLPEVGVHGLRRSFASLAYKEGIPERIAAQIGGWSDIQTMHKHYIKTAEKDKEQAIVALKKFATTL